MKNLITGIGQAFIAISVYCFLRPIIKVELIGPLEALPLLVLGIIITGTGHSIKQAVKKREKDGIS
jgi:hypothetical protein